MEFVLLKFKLLKAKCYFHIGSGPTVPLILSSQLSFLVSLALS